MSLPGPTTQCVWADWVLLIRQMSQEEVDPILIKKDTDPIQYQMD